MPRLASCSPCFGTCPHSVSGNDTVSGCLAHASPGRWHFSPHLSDICKDPVSTGGHVPRLQLDTTFLGWWGGVGFSAGCRITRTAESCGRRCWPVPSGNWNFPLRGERETPGVSSDSCWGYGVNREQLDYTQRHAHARPRDGKGAVGRDSRPPSVSRDRKAGNLWGGVQQVGAFWAGCCATQNHPALSKALAPGPCCSEDRPVPLLMPFKKRGILGRLGGAVG